MASVTDQVKCALCGAAMPAGTQYCPKCGSLNAHFSYPKPPGTTGAAPQATPAAAPSPPAQQAIHARHVSKIPVPHVQEDRPQEEGQEQVAPGMPNKQVAGQYLSAPHAKPASRARGTGPKRYSGPGQSHTAATYAPPAWPGPYVDDPNVELSPTWREGMARVPYRRVVPARNPAFAPEPNTAVLLEMFGIVGFLGLGHMYAGRTARGVLLMMGWWVVFAMLIVLAISTEAPGLIFVMICLGPALSGNWIYKELKRNAQTGPR